MAVLKLDENTPWQISHHAPIPSEAVRHWVHQMIALCRPDRVYWCNGSDEERQSLLLEDDRNRSLNPNGLTPKHLISEQLTFISIPAKGIACGDQIYDKLRTAFDGCMCGRMMYVVPFVISLHQSPTMKVGIEITDSAYVAANMGTIARTGDAALGKLGDSDKFLGRVDSLGAPDRDRCCTYLFTLDDVIQSIGVGPRRKVVHHANTDRI